ncbi:hypothetical protein Vretifemale_9098 [Volvox reticuliferus]|uniref:Uncharacterized protein n=1 Tax=Volvox reticuliferus TaxID=1737510 RepID=A0A8J4CJF8_9CHLO|nr:hypothetical protein Vretifemale_9098 [Volvox reticuliferus]
MQPIWSINRPAVVMDCGTGFSKIGFAGNAEPSFVIPTALGPGSASSTAGAAATAGFGSRPLLGDLDFTIGDEALAAAQLAAASAGSGAVGAAGGGGGSGAATGGLTFPVRQGVVTDWDAMERFWQKCLFHYLRVDPEEHAVVVTEPPLNPPESREAMAEIMFESFNVAGLYVGVQAVLALYAGWATADRADKEVAKAGVGATSATGSSSAAAAVPGHISTATAHLTGTVVDVGEGVAHIIPVVDGFVLEGAIKSLPLAGRAVTGFVQQMLRCEKKENLEGSIRESA